MTVDAWIVMAPGTERERAVPIHGWLAIGRECAGVERSRRLLVEDPEVSREHAEVRIDPVGGACLVDLSTNGTQVNDCRIERGQSAPLRDGDLIRLGGLELVFKARALTEFVPGNIRTTLRTLDGPCGATGLLERDRELAVIDELMRSCRGGEGRAVFVRGQAGIGKTALLAHTEMIARETGMRVLVARGGELERDFAYAAVRQLFDGVLGESAASDQAALLEGAAGLAAPVVGPGRTPALGGDRAFAALHGLYWLTANLAQRMPLLMVVDDAHWCDDASLRFFSYLARRLQGVPAMVVIAARPSEPGSAAGLLGQLASEPEVRVLKPQALRLPAVRELVGVRLGEPDEQFVLSCHRATGGNPFLLTALIAALARDGVAPSAIAAPSVGRVGPGTVKRAILSRLARLPKGATGLAQALAVLGDGAELRHCAALGGLDEAAAIDAFDALVGIELLQREPPLEYVHPIVRAAIYEDIAPGARSIAHARAALLLSEAHADAELVAAHLLASEPCRSGEAVTRLQAAAHSALARGAPQPAITYLRRALTEPPSPQARPRVLHELGRAEATGRDPRAAETFEEALRLSEEPQLRARVACDLAELHVAAGRWDAAGSVVDSALAERGERDPELTTRLETSRAGVAVHDPRRAAQFDSLLPRLRARVERGGIASQGLALLLAAASASKGERLDEVVALVDRGLDYGRFLDQEGVETLVLPHGLTALVLIDEIDRAQSLAQSLLDEARRRGSLKGVATGLAFRGWAYGQRGALGSAEADLRAALAHAQEHGMASALPLIVGYAAEALVERPQLEDIAALVAELELEPALTGGLSDASLLTVRARMRLLARDPAGAIDDLRRCGEISEALQIRNPIAMPWRSTLALALPAAARDEATHLAAEELKLAEATGLPRAEGVALRAAALLVGGERGIELLRHATETLARCPSPLEHGRALTDLGTALRRAGHRREARELLRHGLELAASCGADRLQMRAALELRTAGAKPRRLAFSGLEALTASERRVAEMAADGPSNQEIAEALFVTAKTVENHLGRVYQKLGIHSRERLSEALNDERSSAAE